MPELRWSLIGLGVLFLAGLALWEWLRSRGRHANRSRIEPSLVSEPVDRARRIEPGIDTAGISASSDELLQVPVMHAAEPLRVGVAVESAVDIPSAARFELAEDEPPPPAPDVVIQWPPRDATQVLSLRVVNPQGEALPGRVLRNALEAIGLVHGPQQIYHRVTPDGAVLVSVANLMRPGNLDPAQMDMQAFRGLNVFSVLPGPLPSLRMLDELIVVARNLAQRLSATVQDQHGFELDAHRIGNLRQTLSEGGKPAGDGAQP